MTDIRAVLLVPAEGDPLGLLAEGAPIVAREGESGVYLPDKIRPGWGYVVAWADRQWRMLRVQPGDVALRLAWDGKPVAEGLDRASRACEFPPFRTPHLWMEDLLCEHRRHRAELAMWRGLGTLILLDATGREVLDE